MRRRPPNSKRTVTLVPYTTLFRSLHRTLQGRLANPVAPTPASPAPFSPRLSCGAAFDGDLTSRPTEVGRRAPVQGRSGRVLLDRDDMPRGGFHGAAVRNHSVMFGKHALQFHSLLEEEVRDTSRHPTFLADTAEYIRQIGQGCLLGRGVQRTFPILIREDRKSTV